MGQMTRYCRECGQDQLFDQPHEDSCPDVPDTCPEWACTGCGAALLIGSTVFIGSTGTGAAGPLSGAGASRSDRVA
jgi:hypothetical protein